MKKLFLLLLAAIIFSGCAGTRFSWDDARKIKAGMTTNEVTQLIGFPNDIASTGDMVRYTWVFVNGITFSNRTLSIAFKDGKVAETPKIPESF
jgi:outer membrane protein assembly factor BamE (lipoprotein component of BamABCDE complex)